MLTEPGPGYIKIKEKFKKNAIQESLVELEDIGPIGNFESSRNDSKSIGSKTKKGKVTDPKKKRITQALSYYYMYNPYVKGNMYRSRSTVWFHLFMIFCGFYLAVMFSSWISLSTDSTLETITDNTAIWIRFSGFCCVIIWLNLKSIKIKIHEDMHGA